LATLLTHPFDVIRTKIQISKIDLGMIQFTKLLYKEQGFKIFFRGIFPRILKRSVSSSISWVIYESLVKYFKN
jgi:solute carrier family 25, member 38